MRTHNHSLLSGLFVVAVFVALTGCKPDYPACDTDKDCKEKEFCVARKCQQCRDTRDCGEGQTCNNGKCSAIGGFCKTKAQCPAGQECIGNRCRPCESDAECPSGLLCMAGSCQKAQCKTDNDCAQDQDCVNGRCVGAKKAATGPVCPLTPVYFGFDQSSLSPEATSQLNTNAECLKKAQPQGVQLVGRADPRGTTEYNLALSDRRAQAVREYLQRLGIDANRLRPVPRGSLDASGTDEAGWSKDRRVDFEWQ